MEKIKKEKDEVKNLIIFAGDEEGKAIVIQNLRPLSRKQVERMYLTIKIDLIPMLEKMLRENSTGYSTMGKTSKEGEGDGR